MGKIEVAAVYCPLWHSYDHMSSWKGEGWCEWDLVKKAQPRFPGHYQPLVPEWGFFDESDPTWSAKEIDLAADHGVDVFLVDWYWYSGVQIMEEALDRGLLRAPNRSRVKFALMWANHDWADYFPPPFGEKWNSWLPSRHSPADWDRVMAVCMMQYFNQPNYWTYEGGLFFSIFQPLYLIQQMGGARAFKAVLDQTNLRLHRSGLPPLHLNGMLNTEKHVDELMTAGFSTITTYNIITSGIISANLTERYEDLVDTHHKFWKEMENTSLPYLPVVTMGWDVTPRCVQDIPWPFPVSPISRKHEYPYISVTEGNTPALLEKLCKDSLVFCQNAAKKPKAVIINAWNEWTEGSYLLPEKKNGTAYLESIQKVFSQQE